MTAPPRPLEISPRRFAAALTLIALVLVASVLVLPVPTADALDVILITGGAVAASTALCALSLRALSRRSIGTQAGVIGVFAIAGVGFGAWLVAQAMFLSNHDFEVLLLVLITSTATAAAGSLLLGSRVRHAADQLTRAIAGSEYVTPDRQPGELLRLSHALEETRAQLAESKQRELRIADSRQALMLWISNDLKDLIAESMHHARSSNGPLTAQLEHMSAVIDDLIDLNRTTASEGLLTQSNLADVVNSSDYHQNQVRVGVGAIIKRDGRILALQRAGSHGASTWCFPGGHQDFGESPEQTAIREIAEETGLFVTSVKPVGFTNDPMPNIDKHYVTLFMECEVAQGEARIMEPGKAIALEWCTLDELRARPIFEPTRRFLDEYDYASSTWMPSIAKAESASGTT